MIDRFLRRFERVIDPFGEAEGADRPRRVGELAPLPADTNRFIWHFARQAKGPLIGLLVTGGLTGAVEAALYTGVGWIVDALAASTPVTLMAEHGGMLVALAVLTLVVRTVVLFAASVFEEQMIIPSFYNRIRWQAYRGR